MLVTLPRRHFTAARTMCQCACSMRIFFLNFFECDQCERKLKIFEIYERERNLSGDHINKKCSWPLPTSADNCSNISIFYVFRFQFKGNIFLHKIMLGTLSLAQLNLSS